MSRRILIALAFLATFLLAFIAFSLTSSITRAAQPDGVQKWEYAQAIFSTKPRFSVVSALDEDEANELSGMVKDIPDSKFGGITILNVMGSYGWELTSEQNINGLLAYVFKRPVQ